MIPLRIAPAAAGQIARHAAARSSSGLLQLRLQTPISASIISSSSLSSSSSSRSGSRLGLVAGRRHFSATSSAFSTTTTTEVGGGGGGGDKTVPLVYDLHAPNKPAAVADAKTAPIIVMHGLFGSKKNNRGISKVLARDLGRYVYAVDLRNHGESPHHHRHDYGAMADDVARFITEHGLKEPTLIGHSMGAKTAMALALQNPSLIANIISVDNAPIDARLGTDFAKYIRAMKEIDAANITRQAEADAILAAYEPSLPIRQFLLGNLYRPSPTETTSTTTTTTSHSKGKPGPVPQKFRVPLAILSKALAHMGDFPFRDPGAARFEKPALFVRGTKSTYVPDEALPVIGQFFPRFELVDVEAGHWVISENPEAFRQAVVKFLEPKDD
ncbi:Alpha/Beta hydrolase protein [Cercophora scortea]|uniref:Alpha/Beta hydrolase protein n=1 Tax=Cercophora scortea TaxID=314031 RepID=A0AAE0MDP5_9PEZI|nr:Alpha/Beta hydrolase protein [Cercophora scortea]